MLAVLVPLPIVFTAKLLAAPGKRAPVWPVMPLQMFSAAHT